MTFRLAYLIDPLPADDPRTDVSGTFAPIDPDAPALSVSDLSSNRGDGIFESIAVVDAALVPLVPGLALLMGLLQFTRSPSPEGLFAGSVLLLTALGVALAIAAGAALGTFVGGPVRTQLVRARSFMPLGGTPRGTASTGHRPIPPGASGEPRS